MRRTKKILLLLLVLVSLCLVSVLFIPKNTPIAVIFLNKNTLNVNVQEGLNEKKVSLALTINGTDNENVIVFNGRKKCKVPKGYGENDWTLSCDNVYVGSFRHFKTNNWHEHDYYFDFYSKHDSIFCDVKILGPDEMKPFTIGLTPE